MKWFCLISRLVFEPVSTSGAEIWNISIPELVPNQNFICIGTQPPLNILVVGNPGAGKSTLLNTILKMKVFKSGVSIGTGMTFNFDLFCNEEDGITYMDTPGLNDISKRQQAADAITTALKHSGQYKVFFVATLEQGRLKPDDIR